MYGVGRMDQKLLEKVRTVRNKLKFLHGKFIAELKLGCNFDYLNFAISLAMGSYHQFLMSMIHIMSCILLSIHQLLT